MSKAQSSAPPSGETPSPLCNALIDAARAVLSGELPVEQLAGMIEQTEQGLQRSKVETTANFEAQGEEHLDRFGEHFEAMARSFDDMHAALESLAAFCETVDEEAYQLCERDLVRAAFSAKYAMDIYQRAEMEMGPTPVPILNLIIRLKDGFLKQGVPREELVKALDGATEMTLAAEKELKEAQGEQPPELQGLMRAYQQQREQFAVVKEAIGKGAEALEEAVGFLITTSLAVRDAMSALSLAMMSQGPCRLQRANVLLKTLEIHQQGGVNDDGLAEALEAFAIELEKEQGEVEKLASLPNDSESVQEELEKLQEAYAAHGDVLELLEAYLEGDASAYEPAREGLIEASEALSDCQQALEEIAENEGKVACVRCGARNEPTAKVCSSCGAQLPQQASASSTMTFQERDGEAAASANDDFQMTENLLKLFQSVNAVAEGQIGAEQFEEVLVWMDTLLLEAHESLPQPPEFRYDDEVAAEVRSRLEEIEVQLGEQREVLVGGVNKLRSGLERLAQYLQDENSEHLTSGVVVVRDGATQMQQAEKAIVALAKAAGDLDVKE